MPVLRNIRHETLVQEYLVDLNQTQAAIRAGYSPKTANEQASRLFTKANIRARVDELMAERSARTGVNQDRVIRELARVAFVNAPNMINMDTATLKKDALEDDTAAIASVKVKQKDGEGFSEIEREIKLADKLKALELLGRHLGMYTDKVSIEGDMAFEVRFDYGDADNGTE